MSNDASVIVHSRIVHSSASSSLLSSTASSLPSIRVSRVYTHVVNCELLSSSPLPLIAALSPLAATAHHYSTRHTHNAAEHEHTLSTRNQQRIERTTRTAQLQRTSQTRLDSTRYAAHSIPPSSTSLFSHTRHSPTQSCRCQLHNYCNSTTVTAATLNSSRSRRSNNQRSTKKNIPLPLPPPPMRSI